MAKEPTVVISVRVPASVRDAAEARAAAAGRKLSDKLREAVELYAVPPKVAGRNGKVIARDEVVPNFKKEQ